MNICTPVWRLPNNIPLALMSLLYVLTPMTSGCPCIGMTSGVNDDVILASSLTYCPNDWLLYCGVTWSDEVKVWLGNICPSASYNWLLHPAPTIYSAQDLSFSREFVMSTASCALMNICTPVTCPVVRLPNNILLSLMSLLYGLTPMRSGWPLYMYDLRCERWYYPNMKYAQLYMLYSSVRKYLI